MGVCLLRIEKKTFGSLKSAEFLGYVFWASFQDRCDFMEASVFGGEAF
jgi:hypothetical protein